MSNQRRWASRWLDGVRGVPGGRAVYRAVVALVGTIVAAGGLLLVPLPGPGWIIVFVGLGILATEFAWARRLLEFGRARLRAWTAWARQQSLWIRIGLSLASAAIVVGAVLLAVRLRLLPAWLAEMVPVLSVIG